MFLFKRSQLVIDFFSEAAPSLPLLAPDLAVKFIPSWWRAIPKELSIDGQLYPETTMRHCAGFLDYFSRSVIVPLWSDFVVEVGPVGTNLYRSQYADMRSVVSEHPAHQRGSYLPPTHYQHLKLQGPWFAKTNTDVSWVISQPTWCFENPTELISPPGVIEFKHQHSLNINLFIPRTEDKNKTVRLSAGQPLLCLTPMSDQRVVVRHHQASREELNKMGLSLAFFSGDYVKKRALRAAAPRCPFSSIGV
jgi:hypothetical protein